MNKPEKPIRTHRIIEIVMDFDPDRDPGWPWTAWSRWLRVGAGGASQEEAIRRVQAMELRRLADRLDQGGEPIMTIDFVVQERS